jgi:hypothetical protein
MSVCISRTIWNVAGSNNIVVLFSERFVKQYHNVVLIPPTPYIQTTMALRDLQDGFTGQNQSMFYGACGCSSPAQWRTLNL